MVNMKFREGMRGIVRQSHLVIIEFLDALFSVNPKYVVHGQKQLPFLRRRYGVSPGLAVLHGLVFFWIRGAPPLRSVRLHLF